MPLRQSFQATDAASVCSPLDEAGSAPKFSAVPWTQRLPDRAALRGPDHSDNNADDEAHGPHRETFVQSNQSVYSAVCGTFSTA